MKRLKDGIFFVMIFFLSLSADPVAEANTAENKEIIQIPK